MESDFQCMRIMFQTNNFIEGSTWIPVFLYEQALKEKKEYSSYRAYSGWGNLGKYWQELCQYIEEKPNFPKGSKVVSVQSLKFYKQKITQ